MKARLVGEDENFYTMDDGKPFRVPKKGLSESMHAKIRGMGAPQKMAGGGMAERPPMVGGLAELPPSVFSMTPSMSQADYLNSLANLGKPLEQRGELWRNPAATPVVGADYTAFSVSPPELPSSPPSEEPGLARQLWDVANGPSAAARFARTVALPAILPGNTVANMASTVVPEAAAASEWRKDLPASLKLESKEPQPARPMLPTEHQQAQPQAPSGPHLPAMPGGNQAGFNAANKAAMSAVGQQAAADVAAVRARAEGLAEIGKVAERTALERKEVVDRARMSTDQAMARYNAAQDEVNRIDASVDPGRFWASRTTGDKVLGIIGLALGAIGAGNDGVNKAAVMLQRAIDRDLDAQKTEYEQRLRKGQSAVEGTKSFYSMARQATGDDLAAFDLARGAILESAANKAAQAEAAAGEPQAKARAAALRAELQQKAAEQHAAGQQRIFDNGLKLGALEVERSKVAAATGARENPLAKDAAKAAAATQTMGQTIGELKSLITKTGPITEKTGADATRMRALAKSLILQIKEAEGLGALDKGSVEFAEELIGDPTATFTSDVSKIEKLDTILQQAQLKTASLQGAR